MAIHPYIDSFPAEELAVIGRAWGGDLADKVKIAHCCCMVAAYAAQLLPHTPLPYGAGDGITNDEAARVFRLAAETAVIGKDAAYYADESNPARALPWALLVQLAMKLLLELLTRKG